MELLFFVRKRSKKNYICRIQGGCNTIPYGDISDGKVYEKFHATKKTPQTAIKGQHFFKRYCCFRKLQKVTCISQM